MGQIKPHPPVLRILAAISRHRHALEWTRDTCVAEWGPLALTSETFCFEETEYYRATMGENLLKTFFAFERLFDPAQLVSMKRTTNSWEESYRVQSAHAEARPLNLDPGYLSEAKLVLASTKDHAHRVYLSCGVYAEVTLHYHKRRWQPGPFTYPDYRRTDYQQFFNQCRIYLRGHADAT